MKMYTSAIQQVIEKRPELAAIFENSSSLSSYMEECFSRNIKIKYPLNTAIANYCYEKILSLLPEHVAQDVKKTLFEYRVFSTSDHHAPLTHQLQVNTNLVYSLIHGLNRRAQIAFSFSGISMSNAVFPRGVYFKTHKIPLLPSKWQPSAVYSMPKSFLQESFCETLKRVRRNKTFSDADFKFLKDFCDKHLNEELFRTCMTYSDQLIIINYNMWREMWRDPDRQASLVYIPVEELWGKIFANEHLVRDSLLWSILFDPLVRNKCCKYLSAGFFGYKSGTDFFWEIDELGRMRSLKIIGDTYHGKNIVFKADYGEIRQNLLQGHIVPNTFLCFLLLSFCGGIEPVGGFNQIHYLPKIKHVLLKICDEFDMVKFTEQVHAIDDKLFMCGFCVAQTEGLKTMYQNKFNEQDKLRWSKIKVNDALIRNIDEINSLT